MKLNRMEQMGWNGTEGQALCAVEEKGGREKGSREGGGKVMVLLKTF